MNQEPIDQFRLPVVAVSGEPVERVLSCDEYDSWALARMKACGHADPIHTCRQCLGVLLAADAFSAGSAHIRLLPAR